MAIRVREDCESLFIALESNPRPPGCRKIRGDPAFRVRLGSFQVIYDVFDDSRQVNVLRIVRRTETTYRRFR